MNNSTSLLKESKALLHDLCIACNFTDEGFAQSVLQDSAPLLETIKNFKPDIKFWTSCILYAVHRSCYIPTKFSKSLPAIGGNGKQLTISDFFEHAKASKLQKDKTLSKVSKTSQTDDDSSSILTNNMKAHGDCLSFMKVAVIYVHFKRMFDKLCDKDTTNDDTYNVIIRVAWYCLLLLRIYFKNEPNSLAENPMDEATLGIHLSAVALLYIYRYVELKDSARGGVSLLQPPKKKAKKSSDIAVSFLDSFLNHFPKLSSDWDLNMPKIRILFLETTKAFPSDVNETFKVMSGDMSYNGDSMNLLMKQLEKELEKHYSNGPTHLIDERMFLDCPTKEEFEGINSVQEIHEKSATNGEAVDTPARNSILLSASQSNSSTAQHLSKSPARHSIIQSPITRNSPRIFGYASPRSPSVTPATPIRSNLLWLSKIVNALTEDGTYRFSEPFLEIIGGERIIDVQTRLDKSTDTLLQCEELRLEGTVDDQKRRICAIFSTVLERIVLDEISRSKNKLLLHTLVNNNNFHSALTACSFVTAACCVSLYNVQSIEQILQRLELSFFEFSKLIESFIRHSPHLPRSIANFLTRCEERILEKLAWNANSSLVAALKAREQETTAEKSEQNGKVPGGITDSALDNFFRKLMYIASGRINELSVRLNLSDENTNLIWETLKHLLSDQWYLMVDRHLDQMILCCTYGVSKVQKKNIKFKDILHCYRSLAHVRDISFAHLIPSVYGSIPFDNGNEMIDIIKFYNLVFIVAMKHFLLAKQNGEACPIPDEKDGTPKVSSSSQFEKVKIRIQNSPLKSPASANRGRNLGQVLVSPMSPQTRVRMENALAQSPHRHRINMTPMTKDLFSESPFVVDKTSVQSPCTNSVAQTQKSQDHSILGGGSGGTGMSSIRRKYADVFANSIAGKKTTALKVSSSSSGTQRSVRPPLPPDASVFRSPRPAIN